MALLFLENTMNQANRIIGSRQTNFFQQSNSLGIVVAAQFNRRLHGLSLNRVSIAIVFDVHRQFDGVFRLDSTDRILHASPIKFVVQRCATKFLGYSHRPVELPTFGKADDQVLVNFTAIEILAVSGIPIQLAVVHRQQGQ